MSDEIQIIGKASLVKSDEIFEAISTMLNTHRNIVANVEVALSVIEKISVKTFLEKKLEDSKHIVRVLEEGFIPVLIESPISLKPISKSIMEELKELMKTLPLEAKAALERAKKLGVFDQFAISGGPRGGDPVIVGAIRNKFFLIAAWINVDGGGAIGYTFKSRS